MAIDLLVIVEEIALSFCTAILRIMPWSSERIAMTWSKRLFKRIHKPIVQIENESKCLWSSGCLCHICLKTALRSERPRTADDYFERFLITHLPVNFQMQRHSDKLEKFSWKKYAFLWPFFACIVNDKYNVCLLFFKHVLLMPKEIWLYN